MYKRRVSEARSVREGQRVTPRGIRFEARRIRVRSVSFEISIATLTNLRLTGLISGDGGSGVGGGGGGGGGATVATRVPTGFPRLAFLYRNKIFHLKGFNLEFC